MLNSKPKMLIISLMVLLGLTVPLTPAFAASDLFEDVCQKAPNSTLCLENAAPSTKNPAINAIRVVTNGFALAAGVGAIIMIILSGLTMVTSSGNPEKVASARRRLTYAIIGLVVVALSWVIIRLITDRILQ